MTLEEDRAQALIEDYVARRIDRREFLQRAAALGISLGAAAALLEGEARAAPSAGSRTLRVRFEVDMGNIDPAFRPALEDEMVGDAVYEGLVSFKPGTWDLVNTLAESFESSPDHLRYHFKLKRGIPFHKGFGEVTASDVKYSFERIAGLTKPNLHAVYQGDFKGLQEVKVESRHAGTIMLKRPFSPLLRSTLPPLSGKVLSQQAVEKLGKKFATHPIGTGPYEFEQWVPKQRIVLKRFAGYGGANSAYAAKPDFDEIRILPITNDSAAETALEAGDVDFGRISEASVDRFSRNRRLDMHVRNSLNYIWMAMNVQDPNLKDINLRHAIRYAVDVPGIIQAAYDGKWARARAILPKTMGIGYWPDAPRYDRDVEKAKSFMKAAGLSTLDLTLTVLDAEKDKTAAQVIQSNLADIGINVKIQPQDSATYYAIPGNGGGGPHRQLVYALYVTEPDPSWSTVWFTCPQMRVWNWDNWCNAKFDGLHNAAIAEFDPAKRTKLYVELQKFWDREASMVWIAYPTFFYVSKKTIEPSLRPDGTMVLWNFRSK